MIFCLVQSRIFGKQQLHAVQVNAQTVRWQIQLINDRLQEQLKKVGRGSRIFGAECFFRKVLVSGRKHGGIATKGKVNRFSLEADFLAQE